MSITLIRQKTHQSCYHEPFISSPIEGRLTCRDISPVLIRTKRIHSLQSTVYTKSIHKRNRRRSLFRRDCRTIFLTTANKEERETMTVTSIDILQLADSEVIFWIEFNILASAFSRPGDDELLSRIHLHLRSRVCIQMSYDLIPMQVGWPMN